jgi:arsenite methyltransferase
VPGEDRWARWVLHDRDGDDTAARQHTASVLAVYRDRVLDRAEVTDRDLLLDVGCGDGLVGFGALRRGARVIFSDVSSDLLAECRRRAAEEDVLDRCRFVHAAADDLSGVADGSVDAVTTRSVLIYVERKPAVFAEFFRVLRPGGRLSIFEPINAFAMADRRLLGLDLTPVADLVAKVWRAYLTGSPDQDPMLNFDERDLLRWARDAGFTAIRLEYRAEVEVPQPLPSTDWDVLKKTAPNPLAPTYQQAMADCLTAAEQRRLEDHVRAVLERGAPARSTMATAYLSGVKEG